MSFDKKYSLFPFILLSVYSCDCLQQAYQSSWPHCELPATTWSWSNTSQVPVQDTLTSVSRHQNALCIVSLDRAPAASTQNCTNRLFMADVLTCHCRTSTGEMNKWQHLHSADSSQLQNGWDTSWNWALINVISYADAFPAFISQLTYQCVVI